ncbi:MAG: hypothetical protein H0V88_11275 [Pyrinomonadaceae bacterium]|nr:hypothetical protein [Pyrinomonadaceae bacterium]
MKPILNLIVIPLLVISDVYACPACMSLSLSETISEADAVIVGRRIDRQTGNPTPKFITLEVLRVLKGQITKRQINVRSYNGMCRDGIVIEDNNQYVVMLSSSGENYDSVSISSPTRKCGIKTLKIERGKVVVEDIGRDKVRLTLDEFRQQFGINQVR